MRVRLDEEGEIGGELSESGVASVVVEVARVMMGDDGMTRMVSASVGVAGMVVVESEGIMTVSSATNKN